MVSLPLQGLGEQISQHQLGVLVFQSHLLGRDHCFTEDSLLAINCLFLILLELASFTMVTVEVLPWNRAAPPDLVSQVSNKTLGPVGIILGGRKPLRLQLCRVLGGNLLLSTDAVNT